MVLPRPTSSHSRPRPRKRRRAVWAAFHLVAERLKIEAVQADQFVKAGDEHQALGLELEPVRAWTRQGSIGDGVEDGVGAGQQAHVISRFGQRTFLRTFSWHPKAGGQAAVTLAKVISPNLRQGSISQFKGGCKSYSFSDQVHRCRVLPSVSMPQITDCKVTKRPTPGAWCRPLLFGVICSLERRALARPFGFSETRRVSGGRQ